MRRCASPSGVGGFAAARSSVAEDGEGTSWQSMLSGWKKRETHEKENIVLFY